MICSLTFVAIVPPSSCVLSVSLQVRTTFWPDYFSSLWRRYLHREMIFSVSLPKYRHTKTALALKGRERTKQTAATDCGHEGNRSRYTPSKKKKQEKKKRKRKKRRKRTWLVGWLQRTSEKSPSRKNFLPVGRGLVCFEGVRVNLFPLAAGEKHKP